MTLVKPAEIFPKKMECTFLFTVAYCCRREEKNREHQIKINNNTKFAIYTEFIRNKSTCFVVRLSVYKYVIITFFFRTRSTTKKLNHCLENQKGYYLRNRIRENAFMLQFISGRLISFWNLFIYVNNSQLYYLYKLIFSFIQRLFNLIYNHSLY